MSAKPVLIGGSFTPTWHVPGCPCDSCIEVRAQMDKVGEVMREIQADPVKKAAFDARLKANLGKHRRRFEERLKQFESRGCDCCHCRRY